MDLWSRTRALVCMEGGMVKAGMVENHLALKMLANVCAIFCDSKVIFVNILSHPHRQIVFYFSSVCRLLLKTDVSRSWHSLRSWRQWTDFEFCPFFYLSFESVSGFCGIFLVLHLIIFMFKVCSLYICSCFTLLTLIFNVSTKRHNRILSPWQT